MSKLTSQIEQQLPEMTLKIHATTAHHRYHRCIAAVPIQQSQVMGSVHLELLQIPCTLDLELFPSRHVVLPNTHLQYKRPMEDHVKVAGNLKMK